MAGTSPSRKKVRLLIVAPSLDILGGQSVQAARLLERLNEEPLLETGFLPINPRLPGVLRSLQKIKYVRTAVTSIAYVASLLLRVYHYDVIHVFSASYLSFVLSPTPAILIGKLYGRKVLLNYHSGEAEDHLRRWRRTAVATIRLVDCVVVPSEYLVRVFASFGLKASAIFNLIDTSKFPFRARTPLRPVFLSNRNLESHYGVDRVLRAFAAIQQEVPHASLTVAGDGSQSRSLKELAQELHLRNTAFIGRVDPAAIAGVYDAADVYLNGSEIDNQPLSILEAFSCGIPVVTTNAGGIPDIVTDGRTGSVVSCGDYAAMAKRSLGLLNDPALARQMVQQARRECVKYRWETVRDAWMKVYLNLVEADSVNPTQGRLQKLRKTSFDELRVRGSQVLAAFAERRAWSSQGKMISDEALLRLVDTGLDSALGMRDHFRRRNGPRFFAAFDDPSSTIAELRRRWPESENAIIERANRIVAGRFDLLGFRDLDFGNPMDWHLEPVAGKRAPLVHWSRLNYLNAELFGDKKIVWELNRHQYFVTLGQAYWLTGDERYAETFAAHINTWMDQNPPKLGINWASSLEVAFRSISWLWAFHFFKNSAALTPQTFLRACKVLYLNARHLETYPSTYFSPNTHLTGEALGLFYLGMLLPEFRESARWRHSGLQVLLAQLSRHVQSDGVYFEQSSYYHRYTTDFYLHLSILLGVNREAAPAELEEKVRLLLDHLMYITRPDGTTPLIGDDDGGRLLSLDDRLANDFRSTLATGAALFGRGDYKFVSGGASPESLWLLGPATIADLDRVEACEPPEQSIAFPTGGYYVMRDGWKPDSNYLFFDCGPHGTGNCGHAHADALSFDLAVRGRTLLVDPGTYAYTGSREARDWFRTAAAHNTLSIDEESSSVPAGPFSWKTIARSTCSSWISQPRFDYVVAFHDGFSRFLAPAIHTRTILFLKKDYWVIRDHIGSSGGHRFRAWFHLDSHCSSTQIQDNTVRVADDLQMVAIARNGEWKQETGWVSHCYGSKEEAPVFSFSVLAPGSEELVTFLLPGDASAREIQAVGGLAFEIHVGGKRDVLMLRNIFGEPGRIETDRLASDFAVSWARFDGERAQEPEEYVLIDGQTFDLEGRRLLTSPERVSYVAQGGHNE